MGGYHVGTSGEVAELRHRSVEKVDVLKKANCCKKSIQVQTAFQSYRIDGYGKFGKNGFLAKTRPRYILSGLEKMFSKYL